jgi:4'-phosphopantetheinyl transferase
VLIAGTVFVWRADLDAIPADSLPPLLPAECARANRFQADEVRQRYIRSHGVLRSILASLNLPAVYTRDERGKPYLPGMPGVSFSLSRSHGRALVAVARDAAVGADIERYRPLPEYMAIAERFMPPSLYAGFLGVAPARREREFIAIWTRVEAMLKATGAGLYGAGQELTGEWTVQAIDAGADFAAAVAVQALGFQVEVHDFLPPAL